MAFATDLVRVSDPSCGSTLACAKPASQDGMVERLCSPWAASVDGISGGGWIAGRVPSGSMELDHVLIAVADLRAAAAAFESLYGLTSVEGGRHVGWGTANRIVPLGDAYLELIAVVDWDEAAGSAFGQWVASGQAGQPFGWAVRTDELDEVVQRLDLNVRPGSRPTADGGVLRWRIAGIEQAASEPFLPFFIEWAPGGLFPGWTAVHHKAGAAEITQLIVSGDPDRLSVWLGTLPLAIVVSAGSPQITQVIITTAAGPLVLGANQG